MSVLLVYVLCGLVKAENLASSVLVAAFLCLSSPFCRYPSSRFGLLLLSVRFYRLVCSMLFFSRLVVICVGDVLGFCW